MIASVELGTLREMSVILTFSEKSQLPGHMSQQKLEALNFLQIFSFWFWVEKCPSAITLEMFLPFLCKIIFSVLHFNSLCVASDQLHSKAGIFISLRQLVAQLVLCTATEEFERIHQQSVTEGHRHTPEKHLPILSSLLQIRLSLK